MAGLSGGDRLDEYLRVLARQVGNPATLRLGFLEDATYPDGTPVALVAAVANFGSPAKGIPPRPFFTNMVRGKSGGWGGSLARILANNEMDADKSLRLMGEGMALQLRQSIIDTNAPALSPVTLLLRDRFRSNPDDITFGDVQQARADIERGVLPESSGTGAKPLVWTGYMLNSIEYEVSGDVHSFDEATGGYEVSRTT